MGLQEDAQLVSQAAAIPLKKDDVWYLVPRRWWEMYCDHVGLDPDDATKAGKGGGGPDPGPIDPSELLDPAFDPVLRVVSKDLVEHRNFEYIHSTAWSALLAKYGVPKGIRSLHRKVICIGFNQMPLIDLYPIFFRVCVVGDNGLPDWNHKSAGVRDFSAHDTLEDSVRGCVEEVKGVRPAVRLWIRRNTPEHEKARDILADNEEYVLQTEQEMKLKLGDMEIMSGSCLLFEFQRPDLSWPRGEAKAKKDWRLFEINDVIDCQDTQGKWYESTIRDVKPGKLYVHFDGWSSKWDEWVATDSTRLAPKGTHTKGKYEPSSTYASGYDMQRKHSVGAPPERGAVGLRNLGNTCFMNSTLQCLSNTPGLTEFFVEGEYVKQINRDNPLGWQGKVAESYGNLVREIWSGQYRAVSPNAFKQVIGEFQPRFSGYQQHDSSELLSFLLDGLHEDLNLVKKKPATQPVDSNGRPDEVVAKEAWDRHLLRNQSKVVSTCQGQLKSRVVCPDCNKESITFDPFMFLSVPLPQLDKKEIRLTFITQWAPPTVYSVTVPKSAVGADVRAALAKYGVIPPGLDITLQEQWNCKICRRYGEADSLEKVDGTKDDLLAMLVPPLSDPEWVTILITHHFIDKATDQGKLFGCCACVPLPSLRLTRLRVADLKWMVKQAVQPFITGADAAQLDHSTLYKIVVMSRDFKQKIMDIPNADEEEVDLLTPSNPHGGFAFSLCWNEQGVQRFLATKDFPSQAGEGRSTVPTGGVAVANKPSTLALADCLDLFNKEETLQASEAWYCSTCKSHKTATKKMEMFKLPDTLIIHLKRFTYTRNWREKIDSFVDFPITDLNLAPWCPHEAKLNPDACIYDLYAVSNHFGGLGGGHYTAYAKNLIDQKWYNLDDSSVSHIPNPENTIRTRAAYVLFYQRRGTSSTTIRSAASNSGDVPTQSAMSISPTQAKSPSPS